MLPILDALRVPLKPFANPEQAFLSVEDYMYATSQLAQTTLRSVLGQMGSTTCWLPATRVNQQLQRIVDEHTEPWGVKVSTVEVKQIDLPQDMRRAMSKQAEAERERRAKVINAEGEFQAAAKLGEAAEVLMRFPAPCSCARCSTGSAAAVTAAASRGRGWRARDGHVEYEGFTPGGLAQLGERGVRNAEVEGSNPLPSTIQ